MSTRIGDAEQRGAGKIWQGFSDPGATKCNEDVYPVVVPRSDDRVAVHFRRDKSR